MWYDEEKVNRWQFSIRHLIILMATVAVMFALPMPCPIIAILVLIAGVIIAVFALILSLITQKILAVFRPRFSVRTLAIFVTLVACYFGAWEWAKRVGVINVRALNACPEFVAANASSPAPFLVEVPIPSSIHTLDFYLCFGQIVFPLGRPTSMI